VLAEIKGAGVTKIGMVTVPMEEEQHHKSRR
jgi:hypothetical protein